MFNIFRRSKDSTFNIAAIGNNWLRRPITHEGTAGTLHVRQIPTDVRRDEHPFVSLAKCEDVAPDAVETRTKAVQQALERNGACLPLSDPSVRWGGGEDKGWLEFEHARGLVGA